MPEKYSHSPISDQENGEINELRNQTLQDSGHEPMDNENVYIPDTEGKNEKSKFSSEEIARWDEGAQRFLAFQKELKGLESHSISMSPQDYGGIQAMFLGEKPVVLIHGLEYSTDLVKVLKNYGIHEAGQHYLYDPKQVRQVVEMHPSVFEEFSDQDPDKLMELFAAEDLSQASQARGLLLGFPEQAVGRYVESGNFKLNEVIDNLITAMKDDEQLDYFIENYGSDLRVANPDFSHFLHNKLNEYKTELGITESEIPLLLGEMEAQNRMHSFRANGVYWVDHMESKVSHEKVARLKAAFERMKRIGL